MWSPTRRADALRRTARPRCGCVLALASCGGLRLERRAQPRPDAEQQQDYDRAVVEYTRALKEHPDDQDAQAGARTRQAARLAGSLPARPPAARPTGKLEEALVELQLAAELNPANGDVEDLLRSHATGPAQQDRRVARRQDALETLIEHARETAPPGLELPKDVKLPASLVFRDASSRDVLTALARFANVSVVFDPAFRETPVTIDLRNSTLEDALNSVTGDDAHVLPGHRAADGHHRARHAGQAARVRGGDRPHVLPEQRRPEGDDRPAAHRRRRAPHLAGMPGTNAITIKDTPERIAAAGRVITAIDKARPEVVIDVELLEVDRTQAARVRAADRVAGLARASTAPSTSTAEGFTLRDLRNLTQSDVFLTSLPALYYRLLKTDTNTRTLANPQLRTTEGIAAQARFGERVPVPVTTFAPIATGGVPQQPITSFNYENIGVNIDITPRTHHDDDVSLALKVEVSSISGTGFGGLPTFGNRVINTVIRLQDGETNMLAGLIRDDERRDRSTAFPA